MDTTTDEIGEYRTVKTVMLHVSPSASGTAESFELTLVSYLGAEYNTVLVSQDLNAQADYTAVDINIPLHPEDKLKLTYANTEAKTVSVQVVLE
jgi:hypothetical protein